MEDYESEYCVWFYCSIIIELPNNFIGLEYMGYLYILLGHMSLPRKE
jgi:hypothetical protein